MALSTAEPGSSASAFSQQRRACRRELRRFRTAVVVQPLDPEVPRFDIRRGGVAQARLLAFRQPDLHFGGERQRDLVLHRKDVGEVAVEAVRPDMHAGRRVDQLRGDPDSIGCLADASLEHEAHAELSCDLAHIHRAPLVGEARIAGDDRKAGEL